MRFLLDLERTLMKKDSFRVWLQGKYQEYLYEHDAFNEPVKSLAYYFKDYRWWLRRQYRLDQIKETKKHEYDETATSCRRNTQ